MKVYVFVKMRLLLLYLAVLPAVLGGVINVEKCAWGESYWCSNLEVAAGCGAFKHCMSTVWKNQQLTADPTDVCQYCEVLVDDVHKFINDNKTEADIANFLSTACSIIPEKPVASECTLLVKAYIPQLLEMITTEISPQVICSSIHLCTGLADTVQHSEVKIASAELVHVPLQTSGKPSNDVPICADCKKFFGDIKALITNQSTVNEVVDAINEEVCSLLGSLQQECLDAVKEAVPLVLQYLQQFFDPDQICVSFAFCATAPTSATPNSFIKSAIYEAITAFKVHSSDSNSCLFCKTVLTEIQTLDRSESIQTMIKNLVKNDVCANLATIKSECETYVDQYAPIVFELIATFMDPSTRCRSMGFCSADELFLASRAKLIGAEESKIPQAITPLKKRVTATAPSTQCVICEFVMKEVEIMLENNKTEAAIIGALEKVCSVLPKTVADSCKNFVDTYGPAIISILQTEITPDQVCTLLGLCKAETTTTTSPPALVFDRRAGDTETCLICETIVQYVEAMMENNASVVEVEALVKKICNLLPDTMKTQCNEIVDEYGALIIQYITTKYEPKEVCTMINLCTSVPSVHMTNLVPAMSIPGSNKCTHGPAYWCASQENAEMCGALEHCKTYVWKN